MSSRKMLVGRSLLFYYFFFVFLYSFVWEITIFVSVGNENTLSREEG